jgi:hypothetical protein
MLFSLKINLDCFVPRNDVLNLLFPSLRGISEANQK